MGHDLTDKFLTSGIKS
jgi:hypothetical protein